MATSLGVRMHAPSLRVVLTRSWASRTLRMQKCFCSGKVLKAQHACCCAGNVLLQSAPGSAHGFAAKVADFGLVRDFSVVSRLQTRTYGTVTHMAPEVLSSDTLSRVRCALRTRACKCVRVPRKLSSVDCLQAADVYSFGVVLWELCAGQRAWASLNFAQVLIPCLRAGCMFLPTWSN